MSEPATKALSSSKIEPVELHYMNYKHGEFSRWTSNCSREECKTFWDLCVANYFGGTLPRSPEKLAAICRMPHKQFEQEWPSIKRHFKKCKGGIEIPKIVEWRNESLKLKGQHSKGGYIAAEKRAEKREKKSGPEHAGETALRVVSALKEQKR